jgi:regulator of replication initiation timing
MNAIEQAIEALIEASEIFQAQADDIDPSLMDSARRCADAITALQSMQGEAVKELDKVSNRNYELRMENAELKSKLSGDPEAVRYDYDGYGYKYLDSGSGSDWQTRYKDAEPLYTHPPAQPKVPDEADPLPGNHSSWDAGYNEGWNSCRQAMLSAQEPKP